MKKLKTVDADTLLYEPLEKPSFVVDGLIPTGLSLFCGSQKIGKSWLMLKLCLCVSAGTPFWEMPTTQSDVLYLCLEDTFYRIQDRLFKLTDEASEHLHFAVASCKLSDGLVWQLEEYLKAFPDSRLIVIDTLQKVRTASKDNAYANDYRDISLIKDFADRHSLAVVVVHHIRKQNDSDVFNKVSGTTGLTGSADATFVLEKETRDSDTARLYCVGRDIEYQEFTLRFRSCSWDLVERKWQEQLAEESIPPVLFRVVSFMQDKAEWSGTATELVSVLGETDTAPTVITKLLNEYRTTFLKEHSRVYTCTTYAHNTKACTNHRIYYEDLYKAVLADIQYHAALAFADREKAVALTVKMNIKADGSRGKSNENKLKQARKRYEEVTRLFDRLYEDSLSGRISNDNFTRLIDKYQTEQEQLLGQIDTLQNALQEVKDNQQNAVNWADLMALYAGLQELTAETRNLLIERIEVFDRTTTDGEVTQAIKICYRFGGYIEDCHFKAKVLVNKGGRKRCPLRKGKDDEKVSFVY